MSLTGRDLRYALAHQVPAMRLTVTLHTEDAGDLVLYADAADQVAAAVERVLKAKLAQWERMEREARAQRGD